MSSGAFSLTKYEMDGGQIVPINLQPETLALTDGTNANDAPAGAVTLSLRAKARKGTREYGIGARNITLSWNGSPPTGYNDDNLIVPVLTPAAFTAYTVGGAITYLGTAATVVSKKPEQLR